MWEKKCPFNTGLLYQEMSSKNEVSWSLKEVQFGAVQLMLGANWLPVLASPTYLHFKLHLQLNATIFKILDVDH